MLATTFTGLIASDLFFWGYMKGRVLATPVNDTGELRTRIRDVIATITGEMLTRI